MRIHQVKTRYSNSYVVEEGANLLVIDVAMRCDGFVLKFIQEEMGRDISDVKLVACTHDDPDHIGGVVPMAKACHAISAIPHASKRPHLKLLKNPLGPVVKVATAVGEAFRSRSREMYMNKERNARYAHVHNHHLDEAQHHKFVLPKQRLTESSNLEGFPDWQILHTPGHSWDSICFYHANSGSLITGDTLLGSATKGYLVHAAIYDNPLQRRRTIRRLQALNPKQVFPGHGSIFSGSELLNHL